ncbi:ABC transporter permease [Paenibacillus sp. 1P07SE]|uniref:ABC transporter permease n=1 Tax=Paenibacillus sp. 1P07SE TaxID=3132209 RepID=UPI0039A736E0
METAPLADHVQVQHKKTWLQKCYRDRYLLLLILPCVLYFLLFKYLPMLGIVVSFKQYNIFKGLMASDWVGFKYYAMFLQSRDFIPVMRNTLLLGLYKLVFGFPAPIILALLLNEVRLGILKRFTQSITYLPHFISNVVVVSMMVMFLSPRGGLINQIIGWFGIEPVNFMIKSEMFRGLYVLSEIWQHVGWEAIIYLAALTAIDPQLYEAAKMDGAGRWKQLLHVTFPGIVPAIVILLILNIGKVLEIGFEKVYLLSNPAIYETSDIIGTYVYRTGLLNGNYSYGTAIDVFSGIISLIFIVGANTLSRKIGDTSLW